MITYRAHKLRGRQASPLCVDTCTGYRYGAAEHGSWVTSDAKAAAAPCLPSRLEYPAISPGTSRATGAWPWCGHLL